jgi:hypothetical protein
MRSKFLILIVFLFSIYGLNAQKGYELGGWIGVSNYFGDMNTNYSLTDLGVAGGINFRFLYNERIAIKSSLSYGSIKANDENSTNSFEKQRNLSFKSILVDLTNQLEFNFAPYIHGSSDFFTPYVAVGFDIFYYDPKASYNNKWYSLRELGTEGQALGEEYFQYGVGLVTGGGFKWDINHKLSMNFEITYRFVSTDYLDDVSVSYPNEGELRSLRGDIAVILSDRSGVDGFAVQGKQRGNSRDNDKFSFVGVSMMYYFGSLECPPINKYQF